MTYTLIEYMPACHRASHIAAHNSGCYPHNGAERVYVEGVVRSDSLDPRWAEVIEDGIDSLPEGEVAYADIPEEALAPCEDPDYAADRAYDQGKDDALTGDA